MSGMDVLRERIAGAIRPHLVAENYRAGDMADAVIAALGPVETEWARAFERGDGSLFVDTEDDSYASYSDAAERTTLYDEHSPYDFVVRRYVTPWERIEDDA